MFSPAPVFSAMVRVSGVSFGERRGFVFAGYGDGDRDGVIALAISAVPLASLLSRTDTVTV